MDRSTKLTISNVLEVWIAHSTICVRLLEPSDDAIDLAADDGLMLADALLELSKVLLPSGLEKKPKRGDWEKDKNGYFFGYKNVEIWIESRLFIKMKLPGEAQLGPADAGRFADVLIHLATMSMAERQELIDRDDISMLKHLQRDEAVRDLACRILDRNKADKGTYRDCISIMYLCQNYPERFDMWFDRYANHADGDVLFELAMEARKADMDRAVDLLEMAFQRAEFPVEARANVLEVLVSMMRPENKEDAEKARRVYRRLSAER